MGIEGGAARTCARPRVCSRHFNSPPRTRTSWGAQRERSEARHGPHRHRRPGKHARPDGATLLSGRQQVWAGVDAALRARGYDGPSVEMPAPGDMEAKDSEVQALTRQAQERYKSTDPVAPFPSRVVPSETWDLASRMGHLGRRARRLSPSRNCWRLLLTSVATIARGGNPRASPDPSRPGSCRSARCSRSSDPIRRQSRRARRERRHRRSDEPDHVGAAGVVASARRDEHDLAQRRGRLGLGRRARRGGAGRVPPEQQTEGVQRAAHEGELANYSGIADTIKAGVLAGMRTATRPVRCGLRRPARAACCARRTDGDDDRHAGRHCRDAAGRRHRCAGRDIGAVACGHGRAARPAWCAPPRMPAPLARSLRSPRPARTREPGRGPAAT